MQVLFWLKKGDEHKIWGYAKVLKITVSIRRKARTVWREVRKTFVFWGPAFLSEIIMDQAYVFILYCICSRLTAPWKWWPALLITSRKLSQNEAATQCIFSEFCSFKASPFNQTNPHLTTFHSVFYIRVYVSFNIEILQRHQPSLLNLIYIIPWHVRHCNDFFYWWLTLKFANDWRICVNKLSCPSCRDGSRVHQLLLPKTFFHAVHSVSWENCVLLWTI